jgi:hypothetical protein
MLWKVSYENVRSLENLPKKLLKFYKLIFLILLKRILKNKINIGRPSAKPEKGGKVL